MLINPVEIFFRIADQLKTIDPENMTTAEGNIARLLSNAGLMKFEGDKQAEVINSSIIAGGKWSDI